MSKFKNTEELEKAYKELEREFTKKSQKLAEVEKTNYVALLHNEMDNLLNDYAKRKIDDLEAKLAESEKKNFELVSKLNLKEHKPAFCTLADRDCEALGQVEELKQQLAEKDDELLQKEKKIQDLMLCEFVATTLDFNKLSADNCKLREQLAEHDQDKISFAVEQLEKVKEYIERDKDWQVFAIAGLIKNQIDNQIKQLKEGE